jgi:hypothetical protein
MLYGFRSWITFRRPKMVKYIAVLTLMAILALSVTGCSQTPPKPAKPAKIEPAKTEPPKAEPPPPQIAPTPPAAPAPPAAPVMAPFNDKCASILNPEFIDDKGMVDYNTLKRKKQELRTLLDEFKKLSRNEYNSWPKEDKIAFWLNAYNLQLLKIIADNYPIQSTRIHRVFWPSSSIRHIRGLWTDYKFLIMDEEFTLSEIDRRFFRKEFGDPRIFFAVSQASISGPPLRNEPYTGKKLNEQMEDQVKKYLSNPVALNINTEEKTVYLSALFEPSWYGGEFLNKYGTDKKFKDQNPEVRAILNFIVNYIPAEKASFLEVGNYSVQFVSFDWRVNEQSPAAY